MTNIDMDIQVGDQVALRGSSRISFRRRTVMSLNGDMMVVRGHNGPKYTDIVTETVNVSDYVFDCHNSGAPLERYVLDEQGSFNDGYGSGFRQGLLGNFYQAGGPWVPGRPHANDCRHIKQNYEFYTRNRAAWMSGWKKGQEKARMKQPIDFTKPLRVAGGSDKRPVHYMGKIVPPCDAKPYHLIAIVPIGLQECTGRHYEIKIDDYGVPTRDNEAGYSMVFENAPEPKSYSHVFQTEGGPISINYTILDGAVVNAEWVP